MTLTQITEKGIKDGEIINADINASAAIAGSKINPTFGQNAIIQGGRLTIENVNPFITLTDTNNDSDFSIRGATGNFVIRDDTNGSTRLLIDSTGKLVIGSNTPYSYAIATFESNNGIAIQGSSQGRLLFRHISGGTNLKLMDIQSSNGVMRFRTLDDNTTATDRMVIDSSGRVGIGHNTPSSFSSAANTLVVSTSTGNCGISINATATNASSNLFFTDGTGSGENGAGRVSYEHQNNALAFFTNSNQRMRLDSDGRLLINTTTLSQGKTPFLEVKSDTNTSADFAGVFSSANGTSGMGISYSIIEAFNNTGNATIQLKTNGTDAVRISNTQNVGIGTTNPGQRLEVRQTSASHAIIACNRPNSDTFAVALGNNSSGNGVISVNNSDLVFGRDFSGTFTERMRMRNDGGLTFNGDTASNTALDDYEEGTWTPTIRENGHGTAWNTLSNQQGHYTKVGNLVTVNFSFDYSARASNVNQGFYGFIAGLPHTNTTTGKNEGAGTLMVGQAGGNSAPYHIYLNLSTGNSMPVYKNQDTSTPGPITTSEWPNAAVKVKGTFFYYTQ